VPGWISADEAAILWEIAHRIKGDWLEIGSQTGWSGAHIAHLTGVRSVLMLEPRLRERAFFERWLENMDNVRQYDAPNAKADTAILHPVALRSDQYSVIGDQDFFDGVFIDGDHDSPVPQLDAQFALSRLRPRGVIAFHDFGGPVLEAVKYLLQDHGTGGMHCRIYDTPQMVAVCWRGDFQPPDHVSDPAHKEAFAARRASMNFDFGVCK